MSEFFETSWYIGKHCNKLKSKDFLVSSVSTNELSTLYTTLPHNRIKGILTNLNGKRLTKDSRGFSAITNRKYPPFFPNAMSGLPNLNKEKNELFLETTTTYDNQ